MRTLSQFTDRRNPFWYLGDSWCQTKICFVSLVGLDSCNDCLHFSHCFTNFIISCNDICSDFEYWVITMTTWYLWIMVVTDDDHQVPLNHCYQRLWPPGYCESLLSQTMTAWYHLLYKANFPYSYSSTTTRHLFHALILLDRTIVASVVK